MQESTLVLAEKLGKLLLSQAKQISCAESCTGGGIAYAITSTAGSSGWFNRSFVTYSNEAKQDLLGVKFVTLQNFGAVSQQTVEEMAEGAAKAGEADCAIAVSGIAGPDGGSPEKPVGTVWFGFYLGGEVVADKQVFTGDRYQVREKSIAFALQKMLQLLTK